MKTRIKRSRTSASFCFLGSPIRCLHQFQLGSRTLVFIRESGYAVIRWIICLQSCFSALWYLQQRLADCSITVEGNYKCTSAGAGSNLLPMLRLHFWRCRSCPKIRYQEKHRTCSPTPRNGSHMSARNMCLSGHIFLQIPHHMMYNRIQRFTRGCRSVCRHFLTGLCVQNGALTCLCSVIDAQVASHRQEKYWWIFKWLILKAKQLIMRWIKQFKVSTSGFLVFHWPFLQSKTMLVKHGDRIDGWVAVFLVSERVFTVLLEYFNRCCFMCKYNLLPLHNRKHLPFVFWNFLLMTCYFKVEAELQTL